MMFISFHDCENRISGKHESNNSVFNLSHTAYPRSWCVEDTIYKYSIPHISWNVKWFR
jgi:hypothetical protein